ncbi:MAG: hypothetical protein HY706_04650 [Candidatus Hydrogenedentes bacterium]|nr:hypothetical protein [Candidatus Hydrogenedentota bacterium]
MADEKTREGGQEPGKKKEPSQFGQFDFSSDPGGKGGAEDLGNLPPLSEFESSSGSEFDSNLPPLGSISSDHGEESVGGLPPISSISKETPMPTGGAIKPPPSKLSSAKEAFETPISDSGLDTPEPKGTGFQDLMADSDFSPETPEIGPGPDSDLETPMFDSAFGAGAGDFAETPDTSAPTQAMETPMFGAMPQAKRAGRGAPGREEVGFEPGAFAGTPVPDFSPDTAAGKPPAAPTPPPKAPKAAAGGGGIMGLLSKVAMIVIGIVVGIVAGGYVAKSVPFVPNPFRADLEKATNDLKQANDRIARMTATTTGGTTAQITPEQIDQMTAELEKLKKDVDDTNTQLSATKGQLDDAKNQLNMVLGDLDLKNQEYAKAQDDYDKLMNQTAVVRARQEGLTAEVASLENLVGTLEEANSRRMASKEALEHDIDRLSILVREGIPLTPEKYSRDKRLAAVATLKEEVAGATHASPELLDAYTSLYQAELDIAASREYFFARVPGTDRIGNQSQKWAECLMNGNWSVYYRTLDGKNVGIYRNVAPSGTPQYAFEENLPGVVQKQIEQEIIAARVPGYEQQVQVLAERELMTQEKTPLQRVFDSL